ncbi:MAG TPA: hypothetical protein VL262_04435 [Vicinamibacterales bacterium]|jgi:hypothetical protein|nr:hypothetical protein [Vicinamibacterales bacterium]
MSWTRALVVCALLAVSPLSGVRIVCVIEPPAAGASLGSDDPLACQTFCSTHPTAKRTRCAFVQDPTCAYALGSAAAVLPDAPSLPFAVMSEPFARVYSAAYAQPALDRGSPPPKA